MKMRKLMAMVLSTLMVLSLASCGNEPETSKTKQPAETEKKQESKFNEHGTFPILKEKMTLSVGVQQDQNNPDWDANAMTKELEEKGNVDLKFEVFPAADTEAKIAVMISSQTELPDVISMNLFPNLSKYGKAGAMIPTNAYYENSDIAYYFNKRLENDKETRDFILKYSKEDDGNIYGMILHVPEIGNEYPWRMWINKTWLDKLKLPMPKTTDEYYNTLKAFVKKDPNGNGKPDEIGLIGSTSGWNQKPQDTFMNPFIYTDPDKEYLMAKDGKLDVSYNKPEWKAGLEYLNKLVKDGLLSPLTFTQKVDQFKSILESEDAQVVGSMAAGSMSVYKKDSKRRPDMVTLPPLTGPNGQCNATYKPSTPAVWFSITKYCDDPEAAFRVFDYMYEEKMSMWQRYGVPEVDWTTKVDGLKGLYEDSLGVKCGFKVIDTGKASNGTSLWANGCLAFRPLKSSFSMQGIAISENPMDYTIATANAVPHYLDKHPKEVIAKILYSQEEEEAIADIRASLKTFREESVARFITGDKPFSEWDSYVAELEKIGLSKFIEASQKAYDRMK